MDRAEASLKSFADQCRRESGESGRGDGELDALGSGPTVAMQFSSLRDARHLGIVAASWNSAREGEKDIAESFRLQRLNRPCVGGLGKSRLCAGVASHRAKRSFAARTLLV